MIALFLIILTTSNMAVSNDQIEITEVQASTDSDAPKHASLSKPQGLLVETSSGQVLQSENADLAYNPASGVKILTAFAVLKTLGPQFRFKTQVQYVSGTQESVLTGLTFAGNDPFLEQTQLQQLTQALSRLGVSRAFASIDTSLDFAFQNQTGTSAVNALYRALRKTGLRIEAPRNAIAKAVKNEKGQQTAFTSGSITIESKPLLEIVKDCLSRSDNLVAEKLGKLVGGPTMVSQIVTEQSNLNAGSIALQSSSGLGINRVTPRAMMAVLTQFRTFLRSHNLELSAALPIAGIDHGTIFKRFAHSKIKGVMTGKTGTLKETDFGASVLVGELSTQSQGKVLFVVFQKGRNTAKLRQQQDKIVEDILTNSGGPGGKYT